MELDTCSFALAEPRKADFDYARWSDSLPDKLWNQILRNLSLRDICVLAQVDKKFSALCSDEAIWQYLFIRQFAKTYADSRITSIAASCRSWKNLCKGAPSSLATTAESTSDLPAGSVPTPQQAASSPILPNSSSNDSIPVISCTSSTLTSASDSTNATAASCPAPTRCAPSLKALASSQLPLRKRFKGYGDYSPATASPLSSSVGIDSSSDERAATSSPRSGGLNSSWGSPAHTDLPPRKAHKWAQLTRDVKSPSPPPEAASAFAPTSPVPAAQSPPQPSQQQQQQQQHSTPLPAVAPLPPVLKPTGNSTQSSQPKKRVQIAAPPPKKAAGKAKQRPVDSLGEPLYCFCRRRYDPKVFMIACDLCDEWYHGACVGITEQQASRVASYICPQCRGENAVAAANSGESDSDDADDALDVDFRFGNGRGRKRKNGNALPKRTAA